MNMNELIDEKLIKLKLGSKTKDDVIDEMIELLEQNNVIRDKAQFKKEIYMRENLSTTGIGFGIAIPHAKSKTVNTSKIAIGISKEGIDYDSIDGEKVFMVFMIAVKEGENNLHLKALASLSGKLMHEDFRKKLLKAEEPSAIYKLVCGIGD